VSESSFDRTTVFVVGDPRSILVPDAGKLAVHAKFVVVRNGGSPKVIVGRYPDYSYHADVLESWCNLYAIPCGRVGQEARVEIYDKAWRIEGGGWAEIKPTVPSIRLFGISTAYGGFSENEIIPVLIASEIFSGYNVI
jgi:Janus/Ocnus family (Ocnus)